MAETDYTWKIMTKNQIKKKKKKEKETRSKNKAENKLTQIAKSHEEIKQLSLKVLAIETSVKKPLATNKATEKSLEEMKQLLLKVIYDQTFDKEFEAAAEATVEISLEEIKQLLLKLIVDQSSVGKELAAATIAEKYSLGEIKQLLLNKVIAGKEPAAATAADVYEMTKSLEEMNKSLTKVLAASDHQKFLPSASSSSTTTADEKYDSETKYTIIDCIKILNQLKTISWDGVHEDGPHHDMFVQFLKMLEDQVNIEIFMNLSDELRNKWINGLLLQMIKE